MYRDPLPPAPETGISLPERLAGGLVGLLVGDALGVPYEFHVAPAIPPLEAIEMDPPGGFARAHSEAPAGTWSDDGAQALALLDSLLDRGRFDAADFAGRLIGWFDAGRYAVDRTVFDCGLQAGEAIRRLKRGVPPLQAGPAFEEHNGNGSLMRALPLALWHAGDDIGLVEAAHAQSRVTHGHARAQVCCALYCLWARALLAGAGGEEGWQCAVTTLGRLYRGRPEHLAELEFVTRPEHGRRIRGSGYVLHTLWAARHALRAPDYEAVVRTAISLGGDTDTTACVAGGLAGIREGVEAIPVRWRQALRGGDIAAPLLVRLLRRFDLDCAMAPVRAAPGE